MQFSFSQSMMIYLLVLGFLVVSLMVYFRIAVHYKIIDRPTDRSSHSNFTVRGAGIIFLIAMLLAGGLYTPKYNLATLATFLIGGISFVDDRISLSRRLRILVQVLSVSLLFYALDIFNQSPLWAILPLFILIVGIINAYNFMDGINGITGVYSLVVLGGLQYVNFKMVHFIDADLIWFPMLACGVFLYFNFRVKAKCFAGDVGSISMAFWVVFLLLRLVMHGGSWAYFLFLSIYGVDSVLTIAHRLLRKENIFEPHRIHFFQLLANEVGWSHLFVSSLYAVAQAFIVALVLWLEPLLNAYLLASIVIIPPAFIYLALKPRLMRLIIEEENVSVKELTEANK